MINETVLDKIENLIKMGKMDASRSEIKKISPVALNRNYYARLTHLSRRSGLNQFGLKLLAPVIHPEKPLIKPATAEEQVAYASCLTNIGATEEAVKILTSLPAKKNPEIFLFQAFAYFSTWKYGTSIPILKQYLNLLSKEDYNYWVGVTNLCAALIAEDYLSEAEPWLLTLKEKCQEKSYHLLLGNALMLMAQLYIQNHQYETALRTLQQAEEMTQNNTGLYHSLTLKWKLIIELLTKPTEATKTQVSIFRKTSIANNFWEAVRDIDFYTAKAFADAELFYKVYYGTPYVSYRRRIKKNWSMPFKTPEHLTLNDSFSKGIAIDKITIETDFLSSKLFFYLVLDHYQPIRGGKLFSSLYPKEYYNPFSSPHRLNQLVHRFKKEELCLQHGMSITCQHFSYKLNFPVDKKIVLPLKFFKKNSLDVPAWLKTSEVSSMSSFTSLKLQKVLNISQRTAQRYLQSALENNLLIKQGKGPSTSYRVKKK